MLLQLLMPFIDKKIKAIKFKRKLPSVLKSTNFKKKYHEKNYTI